MIEALLNLLPDVAVSLILPALVVILPFVSRRIPRRPIGALRTIGSAWVKLSRRPVTAAALLCAIQLAGVGLHAVVAGAPAPFVHDEFSYLLAGQTFASGRITNPQHPMWVHFEAPHVLMTPTMMSKYPPGQAVFLAVGYLLGHPWIGVILSTLVMIVLLYWAASKWLAPWWALAVGVFGLGMVMGTYWSGTYWGGAVNAAAGALVTGSAGVLRRRASAAHLSVFAVGTGLCGFTRQYEGLVLVVLTSGWLLWRAARRGKPGVADYLRRSTGAAAIMVVIAGVFFYYNYRVTGNPLLTPYSLSSRQYLASRMFIFQDHPPIPKYRHKMMEDIYVGLRRSDLPVYWRLYSHLDGFRAIYAPRLLFPLYLLALYMALRGRQRATKPVVLMTACGGIAVLLLPYMYAHYYAPFAACFAISMVAALRGLRAWRWKGNRPGWVVLALCMGYYVGHLAVEGYRAPKSVERPERKWAQGREQLIERLARGGGRHLILVSYAQDHNWHRSWVYNEADIDKAAVVWAREMNPAQDAEIIRYFADRKVWLLEADAVPPRLTSYPEGGTSAGNGHP